MDGKSSNVFKYLLPFLCSVLASHLLMVYVITDYQYPGVARHLSIDGSNITVKRSEHLTLIGYGENTASELYKTLGWMHARDRYVQMCLMRLASQGRLTEVFPYAETNYKFDLMAKQFDFHGRNKAYYSQYEDGGIAKDILQSYTAGINNYLENHNRPFEFVLVNYHPEPFTPTDVTTFISFVSYVGLDEICFAVEKVIIEFLISEKVSHDFLKQVFHPHLNNLTMDYVELYRSIKDLKSNDGLKSPVVPAITNSNNWVISGALSSSGLPIMSSDPHLDVSKYPNTFYESSYKTRQGNSIFGISVPGIPIILMGRSKDLSFTLTYGMMDMGDYFLERIKDGMYERDGKYFPLKLRKYIVVGKDVLFYETEEGHVIERNVENYDKIISDGIYLAVRIPDRNDEVTIRQALIPFTKTVEEAQKLMPQSNLGSNYLLADSTGNIGYQQAGSVPLRPNSDGLLPLPAWDSANLWTGYLSDEDYMTKFNPPEQFIATANNLNQDPNKPCVNTYPALPTRVNRIKDILRSSTNHSVEDMMKYQGDTFSTLADITIPLLEPFLPNLGIGNELRHWDRRFQVDSRPSALWFKLWNQYTADINSVIFGREMYDKLEPIVFNKYTFYKFAIIGIETGYVDGVDVIPVLKKSLETTMSGYQGEVYGDLRKYFSNNMFFTGQLPKIFGFDIGPYPTNSGFEVIKVGSLDKYLEDPCVFTQTWRFITDMSTQIFYSILPGGPSGNYFSNIYKREVDNYINEVYKVWEL